MISVGLSLSNPIRSPSADLIVFELDRLSRGVIEASLSSKLDDRSFHKSKLSSSDKRKKINLCALRASVVRSNCHLGFDRFFMTVFAIQRSKGHLPTMAIITCKGRLCLRRQLGGGEHQNLLTAK